MKGLYGGYVNSVGNNVIDLRNKYHLNKRTSPMSTSNIPAPAPRLYDEFGCEIVSATSQGKPFALLEDETRLKVLVSAVYIIGNEEVAQPDGSKKTRYAIGVQYDSLRSLRYEDGTETGRTHSWYQTYTFSYHEKSNLAKTGLLEACAVDLKQPTITEFIRAVLGKQVSGRVKHRPYEKDGQKKVSCDLEALKIVSEQEDFATIIAAYKPHRQVLKRYPACRVITAGMRIAGKKVCPLTDIVAGPATESTTEPTEIK